MLLNTAEDTYAMSVAKAETCWPVFTFALVCNTTGNVECHRTQRAGEMASIGGSEWRRFWVERQVLCYYTKL